MDYCSATTGGWEAYGKNGEAGNISTTNGSISGKLVLAADGGNDWDMFITTNKVNLKDIETLIYNLEYYQDGQPGNIYIGISDNKEINQNFVAFQKIECPRNPLTQDLLLNVSDYDSSYYIKLIVERTTGSWCTTRMGINSIYGY